MAEPMDVAAFLEARSAEILASAEAAVARTHLEHYEAAGPAVNAERLAALMAVLLNCLREHRLEPALEYGESLAHERHATGYELSEVQTVINVLEESVWRTLAAAAPRESQGYALGLVSTVLGAAKDKLACTYVSRIASAPTRTLRLDYLFEGSEGNYSRP